MRESKRIHWPMLVSAVSMAWALYIIKNYFIG